MSTNDPKDMQTAVLDRYKQGAREVEPALCCPITNYDRKYLDILPQEILDKDYGCGDPSQYVNPGDTVIDLGSDAGKICYILSQMVGEQGKVIGVDFNDEMLDLARKYQDDIAKQIGYHNTHFVKARIQDMALDLDRVQSWLQKHPINNVDDVMAYEVYCDQLRRDEPLIAANTVDAIVSNCVLNLVDANLKAQLFKDMFRVLKNGGRAVISDIVCDETPSTEMINDPDLWSGCISGAFREDLFLKMFLDAGFHGVEILSRAQDPWHTINGIEFRSMTVRAYKGKEGPCLDRNQAVVYKGPWSQVKDDDGHTLFRGQRMAVCEKTFNLYTNPTGPYAQDIVGIEPHTTIPLDDATPFNCRANATRSVREQKGEDYTPTIAHESESCCEGGDCC
ncbi:MAG: methyltransferase domain-containing protein [Phycisphaeraceae bacterium]|nr:methyltransferase domain-containing protein [Phycisphaeraceae bacterium]